MTFTKTQKGYSIDLTEEEALQLDQEIKTIYFSLDDMSLMSETVVLGDIWNKLPEEE